ncbi:18 kDa heat shock protein [Planctomycetes bacterium Pan216]|uniref:18 kDa heat shock protein n=1 Tax=Kolteria novifilia TaxID=2527975 RepID=A0A518B9Y2_9BACT|nr:18 kDa heat shock protein [Planctomycetes bacterium Pan216]
MSNESTSLEQAQCQEPKVRARSGWTYRPDVDVVETAEGITLVADLPGADVSSIDVKYEQGTLTISASIPLRQDESTKYLVNEYGVGDYHRQFNIRQDIDASKIEANYVDGVLTVRLPKPEVAQPRKITVKAE